MGFFFETLKKNYIIEELRSMNVNEVDGRELEACEYDRLKEELVLASFRRADVESDSAKWF